MAHHGRYPRRRTPDRDLGKVDFNRYFVREHVGVDGRATLTFNGKSFPVENATLTREVSPSHSGSCMCIESQPIEVDLVGFLTCGTISPLPIGGRLVVVHFEQRL